MSQPRVWKRAKCRKQFSATTGTMFHCSKVSLQIWLMVFFEMCANKNGLAAREVERKYEPKDPHPLGAARTSGPRSPRPVAGGGSADPQGAGDRLLT